MLENFDNMDKIELRKRNEEKLEKRGNKNG